MTNPALLPNAWEMSVMEEHFRSVPPDADTGRLFDEVVSLLPPGYQLLITGPTVDGDFTVGLVRNIRPSGQVTKAKGSFAQALNSIRLYLLYAAAKG